MSTSPVLTFLAAPIRHLGESVGAFYVGEKELEFTPEDEETLVMFASQAALVIANARRHRPTDLGPNSSSHDLTSIGASGSYAVFFVARNAGLRPVRSASRLVVVPAGAEHQPVVLDQPEVLVLDVPGGGVHILVVHPHAFLGGLKEPVVKHLL